MVISIKNTPGHRYAMDVFSDRCKEFIGIIPMDDDSLVLRSAVEFGKYISKFNRLDENTPWHRDMIETMVNSKVDSLSRQIIKEYGSHEEYINRGQRRCSKSRTYSEAARIWIKAKRENRRNQSGTG